MNKTLEGRDLRQAVKELALVDGIFWRAESFFFDRCLSEQHGIAALVDPAALAPPTPTPRGPQ